MKLNNYTPNNIHSRQINFQGKGLNLVNDWQHNSYFAGYYKDIANDLAEGIKLYFKKHKNIDNSVKSFHQTGGLSVFFEIPDSKILKISLENPLEFREHNPNFDIPFLTPIEKYAKTYIVIQPKADTKNITKENCLDVIKRIYRNYCELSTEGIYQLVFSAIPAHYHKLQNLTANNYFVCL